MKLYEEIIFLQNYYKGKYCIENVVSYYEPLIKPQKIAFHFYWANFIIPEVKAKTREHWGSIKDLENLKGFDLSKWGGVDKKKLLRNCVEPEAGKAIFDRATSNYKQFNVFE